MQEAKALFICNDGNLYPDTLVCSGKLGNEGVCQYFKSGCLDPIALNESDPLYSIDKGKPGDLCPPCAKQQLGNLGHWQDAPEEYKSLRLFKCRMWIWFVVPGLHDSEPTKLSSPLCNGVQS